MADETHCENCGEEAETVEFIDRGQPTHLCCYCMRIVGSSELPDALSRTLSGMFNQLEQRLKESK